MFGRRRLRQQRHARGLQRRFGRGLELVQQQPFGLVQDLFRQAGAALRADEIGQVISDVVPDPLLVKSITQSGEIAMRSGTPRLERCRGPVLATDGLRNFAWYRLSLPVWRLGDDTGRTPHGILVVLSPDWNDEEAA